MADEKRESNEEENMLLLKEMSGTKKGEKDTKVE